MGPRAQRVQRPREQFFAGTTFSFEQHGRVGSGRALERNRHLFEAGVLSDNPRRATAGRELVLEQDVFSGQTALRKRALDHQHQDIRIDGLREKIEGAFLHGGHRILNAAERRHDDHRQFRIEILRGPQDAEAIPIGQSEIRQDDARPRRLHRGHGLGLVARFDDRVILRFERKTQHGPQRIFVFDEQDGRIRASPGSRRQRSQPGGTPALRASSSKSPSAF
jgi:hypothetical protein